MSVNNPNNSPHLNESTDKINVSDAFNTLELKFAETYQISIKTIQELSKFIHEKESIHILDSTQEKLKKLNDFIDSADISEQEKEFLANIPNDSFTEFANQVFSLREIISQQKNDLKESILGSEKIDFLSSKKPVGISDARYIRACNPIKPHHHLDSCIVGIYQLGYSTIKLAGGIGIDLGKAVTTDAYKLLSGKAKLPNYNI